MTTLQQVSEQAFEQEVLTSELPVLVEFGAEWCGPCKTVLPELEALKLDLEGKAKIVQVDVDKSPRLAQMLRIQSVPSYIVFNQGRPVEAGNGALNKAQLRALIEPVLPRAAGAITAAEAAKLVQAGQITFVDTRPEEVYKRSHIEGAVSFPMETIADRIAELNMLPSPGVLYCRTGRETAAKAAELAASGAPIAFLEGGVFAWEGEGFRLIRPS